MKFLGVKFKELLNAWFIALKEGYSKEVNLDRTYEKDSEARLLIIAL